ncbi:hypothetical protein K0U07_02265 [bacterium]|nr:hypothetical protein [bacterium]
MIEIRERYSYFTHLPGKESVVPLSHVVVRAYPTKIFVGDVEVDLLGVAPVSEFTHLVDMDRARVEIFGRGKDGYFHFFVFAKEGSIFLKLYRGEKIDLLIDGEKVSLSKKEKRVLFSTKTMEKPVKLEKISFGCTKKPLLEKGVDRTTKMFALSQLIPKEEGAKLEIEEMEPFLVDLFSPKTEDVLHLGVGKLDTPAFSLFSSFYEQMKSFLVQEKEDGIDVLPQGKKLPIAGRAQNIECSFGTIDILWRKGRVIRLNIFAQKEVSISISFPGMAKSFRVKEKYNDKGSRLLAGELLHLEKGKSLFLDKITY